MVRQASPRTVRALRGARFGLLAFVAAFVAHDAVFLAHYGLTDALGAALRDGVHGAYLPLVGALAALAAATLAGAAVLRVGVLRHRLRTLERGPGAQPPIGPPVSYRRELVGLWVRLFFTVALVFTVQENLEHAVHHHLLGLGALWSEEYPFAVPVLGLVTFVAAALGALVRWRIALLDALVAQRFAAATRPVARPAIRPAARWWIIAARCLHHWTIARQDPCRAPPARPRTA